MFDSTNNRTSVLVSSQLPAFVRDDHENFVKFVENYYKFLEQDGQLLYVTKNFTRFLDPDIIATDILLDSEAGEAHGDREDESYHIFLQKLWDNFLALVPDTVKSDRTLILKHAKDFYRSCGSEKSVRFLMRILYNKEVDIYYPKRDILKASDGKWIVEKSIKVRDIAVNNVANSIAINNFSSKFIRGAQSNAIATVEKVESFFEKGVKVTEMRLSNVLRDFTDGETVYTFFEEESTKEVKYLSANTFGGSITSVLLVEGGAGYIQGTEIPVIANNDNGLGASIIVSSVSRGSIGSLIIQYGGAGYRANDNVAIIGGGGRGATAIVAEVSDDNKVHPNTYTIMSTLVNVESNTPLNNAVYSNLNSGNLSSSIASVMNYWQFSNTGPVTSIVINTAGVDYEISPKCNVTANTLMSSLGILGSMKIINGGSNYRVGNKIKFTNPIGSYGDGALGNVTSVASNGMITGVSFDSVPGFLPGGSGYNQSILPTAEVETLTGSGAVIRVASIIGAGDELTSSSDTLGKILRLSIVSGGKGYLTPPTLDFANVIGNGASAVCNVVSGVVTSPGRYLNDDGKLSEYNFIQDRDYYQNFSYVVRVDESLSNYRKTLTDLIHPAGTKLFGEYLYEDENLKTIEGISVIANIVTASNT